MRNLKYAILGLLARSPMTGYDISKEFDKAIADFWNARYSQIHPELKRLHEEGLVSYQTVMHGEQQEKKLYSITEEGMTDFIQWLADDELSIPSPKDIMKLRLYFSDFMDADQLLSMLKAHQKAHSKKLEHLKKGIHRLFHETSFSSLNREQQADYMVVHQGMYREQAYIDWLTMCIALLEQGD